MFASLVVQIPALLGFHQTRDVSVLREPTIGSVIPDVLIGTWPTNRYPADHRLTYVEAHIVSAVERLGGATRQKLLKELHLSDAGATRAIERLSRSGALQVRGRTLIATERSRRARSHIVALELKIRRWREALDQAIAYRRFADRSYVVMDAVNVQPSSKLRELFSSEGIGLILQFDSHAREVIVPRRTKPATPERLQALEKLSRHARRKHSP